MKPEVVHGEKKDIHPKVLDWWRSMVRMGHPPAGFVRADIQARLDAWAAERGIEEVMRSA